MDKKKIIDALKRSAVIMAFATVIAVGIIVLGIAFNTFNGWVLLGLIPVIGCGAFMCALNPFGWFDVFKE